MKTIYFIICLVFLLSNTVYSQENEYPPPFNNDGKKIIEQDDDYTLDSLEALDVTVITAPDSVQVPQSDTFRRVFWVHGLNGSTLAWRRAAFASEHVIDTLLNFPPRKLNSITELDYHEQLPLENAGGELDDIIRGKANWAGSDTMRNFLIGHSQGGLVIRAMYQQLVCVDGESLNEQVAGGYVTFHTSHQGAHLLSNINIGYQIAENMCQKLGLGPAAEFIENLDDIKIEVLNLTNIKLDPSELISYDLIEKSVDSICKYSSTIIGTLLTNMFVKPITVDYNVGAAYLDELNNSCIQVDTGVYKIAFYGTEPQEHIFARTLHYLMDDPNTYVHAGRNYGYFGANYDFYLWDVMKGWKLEYIAKAEEYRTRAENLENLYEKNNCKYFEHQFSGKNSDCWLHILNILDNPLLWFDGELDETTCYKCYDWWIKIPRYKKISHAFQEGVDWFEGIDHEWQVFIGAYEATWSKHCDCCPKHDPDPQLGDCRKFTIPKNENCNQEVAEREGTSPYEWLCKKTYEKIVSITPNDGIVLVPSQRNLPHMTLKEGIDPKKDLRLYNTSHMQARNNSALKEKLFRLYEGDYHWFFKTDEKDN